jgi:hypothetical protein
MIDTEEVQKHFEAIRYDNIKDLSEEDAIQKIYQFFKFIKESSSDDDTILKALAIGPNRDKELSISKMPDEMLMLLSNALYNQMIQKGGDVIIEMNSDDMDRIKNKVINNEELTQDEKAILKSTVGDMFNIKETTPNDITEDLIFAELIKGVFIYHEHFKDDKLPIKSIIDALSLLLVLTVTRDFSTYNDLEDCMNDFDSEKKTLILKSSHDISNNILQTLKETAKPVKGLSVKDMQLATLLAFLASASAMGSTISQEVSKEYLLKLIDFAFNKLYDSSEDLLDKVFDDTDIIGKELEKTEIGNKDCSSVKNCSDCDSFKECKAIQKTKDVADSDMLKVADFIDKNGTERVSPKEKSEHMKNMLKDEE